MSESMQFWLAFAAGLAVSVAGIVFGIRAEARNRHQSSVTIVIALGGVVMIAVAKLWRDPNMPALQAMAIMLLLLSISFFIIWLVMLRQPIHNGEEKDVPS